MLILASERVILLSIATIFLLAKLSSQRIPSKLEFYDVDFDDKLWKYNKNSTRRPGKDRAVQVLPILEGAAAVSSIISNILGMGGSGANSNINSTKFINTNTNGLNGSTITQTPNNNILIIGGDLNISGGKIDSSNADVENSENVEEEENVDVSAGSRGSIAGFFGDIAKKAVTFLFGTNETENKSETKSETVEVKPQTNVTPQVTNSPNINVFLAGKKPSPPPAKTVNPSVKTATTKLPTTKLQENTTRSPIVIYNIILTGNCSSANGSVQQTNEDKTQQVTINTVHSDYSFQKHGFTTNATTTIKPGIQQNATSTIKPRTTPKTNQSLASSKTPQLLRKQRSYDYNTKSNSDPGDIGGKRHYSSKTLVGSAYETKDQASYTTSSSIKTAHKQPISIASLGKQKD